MMGGKQGLRKHRGCKEEYRSIWLDLVLLRFLWLDFFLISIVFLGGRQRTYQIEEPSKEFLWILNEFCSYPAHMVCVHVQLA